MQKLVVDLLEVEWSRCQARLSGPVRRRHRRRCYSYSHHWVGCAGGISVLPPGCRLLDTQRICPRPRFLCGAWTAIHHHTVDVRALEAGRMEKESREENVELWMMTPSRYGPLARAWPACFLPVWGAATTTERNAKRQHRCHVITRVALRPLASFAPIF